MVFAFEVAPPCRYSDQGGNWRSGYTFLSYSTILWPWEISFSGYIFQGKLANCFYHSLPSRTIPNDFPEMVWESQEYDYGRFLAEKKPTSQNGPRLFGTPCGRKPGKKLHGDQGTSGQLPMLGDGHESCFLMGIYGIYMDLWFLLISSRGWTAGP